VGSIPPTGTILASFAANSVLLAENYLKYLGLLNII
jgi:hypothetical protein